MINALKKYKCRNRKNKQIIITIEYNKIKILQNIKDK